MPRGGDRGGRKPLIAIELKKTSVTFRMNPVLITTLKNVAKQRGIKQINLLEQILTEYFEE